MLLYCYRQQLNNYLSIKSVLRMLRVLLILLLLLLFYNFLTSHPLLVFFWGLYECFLGLFVCLFWGSGLRGIFEKSFFLGYFLWVFFYVFLCVFLWVFLEVCLKNLLENFLRGLLRFLFRGLYYESFWISKLIKLQKSVLKWLHYKTISKND